MRGPDKGGLTVLHIYPVAATDLEQRFEHRSYHVVFLTFATTLTFAPFCKFLCPVVLLRH